MRPSLPVMLLAALAGLLVAACSGAATGASAQPAPLQVDARGDWILESGTVDGAPFPLVEGRPITMTVGGATISGTAACNGYFGKLEVIDGRVRLSELGSTAMACEEPVMASEAAFQVAMRRIETSTRDGDTLVLAGPGVELTFVALAPPPISDLIGRTWVLDTIVTGSEARRAEGERATLEIGADGSLTGSTGCRGFTGSWIEATGQIVPTDLAMDGSECPAALADQDGDVISVIEGFSASIEGKELTLTAPGNQGLIYTRAED
jgi:heat shock protein HslJ